MILSALVRAATWFDARSPSTIALRQADDAAEFTVGYEAAHPYSNPLTAEADAPKTVLMAPGVAVH